MKQSPPQRAAATRFCTQARLRAYNAREPLDLDEMPFPGHWSPLSHSAVAEAAQGAVVSLEAAIRQSGDVTILDLVGRVTTDQGQEVLAAELRRLVDGGTRKLLVNLERVAQIDSSGISSLVRAFVTLGRSGGSLKLLRPQGRVRDVLEMTRLLTVMAAFDDEAAALASFR